MPYLIKEKCDYMNTERSVIFCKGYKITSGFCNTFVGVVFYSSLSQLF